MGKDGERMEWHHIVEQNPANVSRFGQRALQNTDNTIPIDRSQTPFGLETLQRFGITP